MAERLESELRALGRSLDVPLPRDVSAAVVTRLSAPPAKRGLWLRLRWLVVVALVLLAGSVTIAASPEVRAGIVSLLRYAGIEIRIDSAPSPLPTGQGTLPETRTVSLEEARAAARFDVLVPSELGAPDGVQIVDGTPPRVVTLMWASGVRLDAFDGRVEYAYYKKIVGDRAFEWIDIDADEPAVWIDGPHSLVYIDRDGVNRTETARMAAKTLIWQNNGITYRLEGDRSLEELTAIAKSLGR
ncbi:hypothetical protein [Tenggerimyces flavus]|uniref:DUF4367 domain-containing protein n=1 Tax=Tenggerimyces flavus TaxID=1708749 RepID=A0ABV7YCA7_9ACTN|nr:hypothetical protein [Tenggerimyces flavus]MBM7785727.1 hypothetical protein [Tenggerimyces flavus]